MMFRNHTFLRSVSAVTLTAFIALSLNPLTVAAQQHDAAQKSGLLQKLKDEGLIGNAQRYFRKVTGNYDAKPSVTSDERLGQLLNDIHEQLKAVVPETAMPVQPGQNGNGNKKSTLSDADIDAKVASVRSKTAEIKTLNADIDQSFKDTEKQLKDAKVPQEILDRQSVAVAQYQNRKAEFERLTGKVEQATDSNDKAGRQTALADLGTFMAKYPNAKPHQYTDPNKLPFRTPDSKVRAPYTTKAQYQASLFPPKYQKVMLAGPIPDGLQLAQATLPEIPNAADLVETEDVQITQAIKDQAAALQNNPVKIFNFVRNQIQFIPSYGSIQGSDMTLQTKRGNAFDTASLLISMLRAAGINARYVYGTIEVPASKVMNWVGGVTKPEAAQSLLGQGGIPNIGIISGGVVNTIQMEHVWVEAFVDYVPSRGAVNKTPNTWVPMDGSFKQYQFTAGMNIQGNVPLNAQSFMDQIKVGATINDAEGWVQNPNLANMQTQMTAYQTQVQTYIDSQKANATLGDVFGARTIVQVERSILMGSLPYKTIVSANTFQTLPDNLRWRFKTNIYANDWLSNSSSPMIELNQSTPQLAGKKITISFVPATQADTDYINSQIPAPHPDGTPLQSSELPKNLPGYLLNMKPEIRVNGISVARGTAVGMGSNLMQHNAIYDPGRQAWTGGGDNPLIAGEYGAMMVDLQGVAPTQLSDTTARLQSMKSKFALVQNNPSDRTPIAGLTTEDFIGDVLYAGIAAYFYKVDQLDQVGAQAAGNVVAYRLPSYGRNFVAASPQLFFGVVRSVAFKSMSMDVGWLVTQTESKSANASEKRGFLRQAGAASSVAEHLIPETLLVDPNWSKSDPDRTQAVSAVKAIAIAARQGQKIYTFGPSNPSNYSTVYSLQMGADEQGEIMNALASGKEVTVHEAAITVSGWTGSGYIIIDPETGVGAYKISGGTNGSSISVCDAIVMMLFAILLIWLIFQLVPLLIAGAIAIGESAFFAAATAVAVRLFAGLKGISGAIVEAMVASAAMFWASALKAADIRPFPPLGETCLLTLHTIVGGVNVCTYTCPVSLAVVTLYDPPSLCGGCPPDIWHEAL